MGHAAACAGALAVQRAIDDEGLLARVRERGAALEARLARPVRQAPARRRHPRPRPVLRRSSWSPTARPKRAVRSRRTGSHARIKAAAHGSDGLICYPSGGTIDGTRGDHVLLAPPYIVDEPQLDELVEKLGRAIDRALADVDTA